MKRIAHQSNVKKLSLTSTYPGVGRKLDEFLSRGLYEKTSFESDTDIYSSSAPGMGTVLVHIKPFYRSQRGKPESYDIDLAFMNIDEGFLSELEERIKEIVSR